MKNVACIACLVLLVGTIAPVAAADAASKSTKGSNASNARITIEIGRVDADKKSPPKIYELLAPLRGSSSIQVSTRLAFPAGAPRRADLEEGEPETVAFSFSSVGLKAQFETSPADGPGIFVKGLVEVSLVRNEVDARAGTAQPINGSFEQRIEATFQDGKPKRVALVDEPGTGAFYLDIKVNFVD